MRSFVIAAVEARLRHSHQRGGPVVTSHDRVAGGNLSASELARYEKLKAREREVLVVGELIDDVVAEIEAAEYGVEPR
jgi:hypothetical protein